MRMKNFLKTLLSESEFDTLVSSAKRTKISTVNRELFCKLILQSNHMYLYTDVKLKLSDNQLYDMFDNFNSTRNTREEIKVRTIHLKNSLMDYAEMAYALDSTRNYKFSF